MSAPCGDPAIVDFTDTSLTFSYKPYNGVANIPSTYQAYVVGDEYFPELDPDWPVPFTYAPLQPFALARGLREPARLAGTLGQTLTTPQSHRARSCPTTATCASETRERLSRA